MAGELNGEDNKQINSHYDKEFSPKSTLANAEKNASQGGGSSQEGESDSGDNAGWEYKGGQGKSGDDLKDAEKNSIDAGDTGKEPGEKRKNAVARAYGALGGNKKWLLAGGLGSAIVTVLLFIAIISILAPFKTVHFATVLRSVGMARFQMYMKKVYAGTILDAAVLTDRSPIGSTVSDKLKGRTMLDRLRGINPPKQLKQLGTSGVLKFDFDTEKTWGGLKSTSGFKGVELYGQSLTLDEFSDKLFGKTYAELNGKSIQAKRQKLTVDKAFTDAIKNGLDDQLALESRAARSGTYNGFRRVSGISMTKWADKARSYAGKKPTEARKANLEESLKNIDGPNGPPKSGIKGVQDDADAVREEAIKAAQEGKTTTPGQTRSKWAQRAKLAGNVSDGVFLTTVACIIHDLNNSFKEAQEATPDRAARAGHDAITAGDQVSEGDSVAEAFSADGDLWGDAEQAVYYKKAVGEPVSDEDMTKQVAQVPDIRGPSGALVDTIGVADEVLKAAFGGGIVGSIPGLGDLRDKGIDKGCEALLNQYVQFGIAGVEITFAVASAGATKGLTAAVKAFISGGLQLAAGYGVGHLLGSMIDKATQSYAGMDYSAATTGPQKYNNAAVGVDYLEQVGARKMSYGRPLSDVEARNSQAVALDELRQENSQKPLTERYFALSNPFSLASQMLVKVPSSATNLAENSRTTLTSAASILLSPSKLIHTMSGVFASSNRLVFAEGFGATGSGHGVDQWGFTTDEFNKIQTDPDFEWEPLSEYVEANWDDMEQDYRACYTFEKQIETPKQCTAGLLGSDKALKWRWYNAKSDGALVLSGDVNKQEDQ